MGRHGSRWQYSLLVVGFVAVGFVAISDVTITPALGSSREDIQREQGEVAGELEDSQADLAEISGELTAAAARLSEIEVQIPVARAAVDTAEAAVAAALARDVELTGELDVAAAQIEATQLALGSREADTERTRREVAAVVREAYRGADLDSLTILIEAGSPQEYTDMLVLARTARRSQDDVLARLAVQQADIRNDEALLEAQQDRLEVLKVEAERQVVLTEEAETEARAAQAALEGLFVEQQATVAGFEAAKIAEEQRQAELQATSVALEQQLAQIAAEEARQAAEAEAARQAQAARDAANRAAPQAPAAPPPPAVSGGDGFLSYPVSARVSSPFGYRLHPILGYQRLHTGMDFASGCGTPIKASADGTVVSAGWAGGYGNQVVVSHGRVGGVSLATSYNHLTSFVVKSGSVSRGQVIAYSGTTGLSTGCHLHFETRESGVPVDPLKWLG